MYILKRNLKRKSFLNLCQKLSGSSLVYRHDEYGSLVNTTLMFRQLKYDFRCLGTTSHLLPFSKRIKNEKYCLKLLKKRNRT